MTLSELRSSFLATLNRRDVTLTQVDFWLQQSVQRAQRLLRTPGGEKIAEIIVGSTFTSMPIPGDYIKLTAISISGIELQKTDMTTVKHYALETGLSRFYCRDGGYFVFGPRPREDDVIRITYTANADELVLDSDSNWIAEIAPDVVLNGALRLAFLHFQDVRADVHEQEFVKAISDLNRMALDDELVNTSVSPAYSFDF